MDAWADLMTVLARLRAEQPDALLVFPDPDEATGQPPPYTIVLAPWATAAAYDLHEKFGDLVHLTVGALPYPPGGPLEPPRGSRPPAELLDPAEVEVELDGPAVVRSGHTLRHGLLLRNLSGLELVIATNGQVTAAVIDPGSGEVVGGYAGAQTLALITFRATPGQTERIPLLIGTASIRPALGYAVPAGEWGLQADLAFGSGGEDPVPPRTRVLRRTPVLPLTVTP
jgi:hypothetical protein